MSFIRINQQFGCTMCKKRMFCVSAGRQNLRFGLFWKGLTELLQHTCWGNTTHPHTHTHLYLLCVSRALILIKLCLWSLQELLLCPVWRIQEYVTLLQALCVHTHSGHPDHTHLSSALTTLLRFREFTQKVPRPHRAFHQHLIRCETVAFLCVVQWTHRCFLPLQLKRNSERDGLMEETQQMIQGCPVKTHLPLPVF